MSNLKLSGIYTALTASFDHTGALYKAKVLHNVSKMNDVGLSGYLVCGSTGETPLLGSEERLQMMAWVREAAAEGKTLIAGVGADGVHETVRMANRAADLGFHAVLALTPFYYRLQMHRPETQLLYFRAVADQAKLPVLLYNIPQVTGYQLLPETVAALAEHPNIAGLKDSSGNLEVLRATLAAIPAGFPILVGSGTGFCESIRMGAAGAILGVANAVPYACVTVWEALRMRQTESAVDWQTRLTPLAKLIGGPMGLPGLKHAMDLTGYYGGPPRLPMIPISPEQREEVRLALGDLRS